MKYSLDIGNGNTVGFDGKSISSVASLYHVHSDGERKLTNELRVLIGGNTFVLGNDAKTFRRYSSLAEIDKYEVALPFALALLPRVSGKKRDITLAVSVPDIARYGERVQSALTGAFNYQVNGSPYEARIVVSNVYPEGYGAFIASRRGGMLPTSGRTLVVDIGSGTVCTVLVDNNSGMVLESLASERAGVIDLAHALVNDTRFRRDIGDSPSVSLIFDGLADNTYQYGIDRVPFRQYLDPYIREWFFALHGRIKALYASYMPTVSSFLFTGGGSLLLRSKLEGKAKMVVARYPLTDNATGMYYAL